MKTKIRVLITGSTGLLGRGYLRVFNQPSLEHFELKSLAWSRYEKYSNIYKDQMQKVDITNEKELEDVVVSFKPNYIIHCAAERRPDACEKDKDNVRKLNVGTTEKLIELSMKIGACLFYISSDYVFDGTNPPYSIDAKTNPLSFYGETKRDSEVAILNAAKLHNDGSFQYIILRVPVLYGPVESLKESAVTVVAESVIQANLSKTKVQIDNWQQRFPTHVDDVARCSLQLIVSKKLGIYHFSALEQMTKYDMAIQMGNALGIKDVKDLIQPINEPGNGAPRPHNAQLDITHTVDTIKKELNQPIHLSLFEVQIPLIFKELKLID